MRPIPSAVGPDGGELDVEDLLKIVLVLVIVYIVVNLAFDVLEFALGAVSNVIGLLIVILIVAWFLDII